jgi:beta-barrel assembly-enhancing protease
MVLRRAPRSGGGGFNWGRLIIAGAIVVVSLISYFGAQVYNPVTQENQHINITVDQEVALGLQAAPEMAAEYGGLSDNQEATALVERVGEAIASASDAGDAPYDYEFYLLSDPQTINAFALPGGPIFITEGLLVRLETEGQLAGVLSHEITHVVARHSAEQIAKQQLTQGLTGAAVIAAYDPNDPSTQNTAQVALLIGQLVNLKFGRDDELEADRLGVRWMSEAGYDPRSMIRVMEILKEASGPNQQPEFFSTHPDPGNRIAHIEEAIQAEFPNGVPDGMTQ